MSEMKERVARALYEGGPITRRSSATWDELTDDWKAAFRATAGCAIPAMLKPTEAMVKAAYDIKGLELNWSLVGVEDIWEAMITEASKP